MSGFLDGAAQSASGMKAQALRLRLSAENLANVDTPGYRRKLTSFESVVRNGAETGEVQAGRVRLDRSDVERIFDPGNPLSGEDGFRAGSNVDLGIEIADAREAQRSYEANLRMFDQARQMSRDLLGLLKR